MMAKINFWVGRGGEGWEFYGGGMKFLARGSNVSVQVEMVSVVVKIFLRKGRG